MNNAKTRLVAKLSILSSVLMVFGLLSSGLFAVLPAKTANAQYAVPSCTSATLNGTVIPNGASTQAWFQWGPGSSLVNSTPQQTFSVTSNYSQLINGLTENTQYSFRAVVSNHNGTSIGQTLSFRTNTCSHPLPSVNLVANPNSISNGQSSTLSWTSTNAVSCSALWTGSTATSGSSVVFPTNTTTYNITCVNSTGQSATASATVTVAQPQLCQDAAATNYGGPLPCRYPTPNPTVTISANPMNVNYNGSSTVSWTSQNAVSCNASVGTNGWAGPKNINGTFYTGNLTNTTTYTITCSGSNGAMSAPASVTVTVGSQVLPPTVTLTANPSSIQAGQSSTLNFNSQNANSCILQQIGVEPLSGSISVFPTHTTTYVITCTNATGQSATSSATVTVLPPQAQNPTVTLTADSTNIPYNRSTNIYWTSTNAISCSAMNGTNGWAGPKNINGTFYTGNLTNTNTYNITCVGASGTTPASASITINVGSQAPVLPTVTLTADNSNVNYNGTTFVRWTSTNATSCMATGGTNGWTGSRILSGNFYTGNLTNTTTYDITCSNSSGSDSKSVTVMVGAQVQNPTVTLTADNTNVAYNGNTILHWTSQNATTCSSNGGTNGWAGNRNTSGTFYTGNLTNTNTYNITCVGASGTTPANDSVVIIVDSQVIPDPTITISADNSVVSYNGSTNVRWTSTNATSCTANGGSNGWANPKSLSGIFYTGNLTSATIYNITCTNSAGVSVSASTTVSVSGQQAPTVSIFADNSNVAYNGFTNVRWSSQNATSCTANGGSNGWANPKSLSGIFYTGNLTSTTIYNITCTNSTGQSASASETVTVGAQVIQDPTVDIFADNSYVISGGSTNVRWNSTNATSCVGNGGSNGWTNSKGLSGIFYTGGLTMTTTYNITCTNSAGRSAVGSVTVSVDGQPGSNPTVIISADNGNVLAGGSTNVRWSSTNAISCMANAGSNGWSGPKGLAGIFYTGNLYTDTTFNITCTGANQSAATASVTVFVQALAPTVTLTADTISIPYNSATTLHWTSTNVTSCTASAGTNGWAGNKNINGAFYTGNLANTTSYSINCTNAAGQQVSDLVVITVAGQPVQTCQDPSATNYGGPLPCHYPVQTCQDPSATNYGGPLPCHYPVQTCQDPSATNYGGPLPCQYQAQNPTVTITADSTNLPNNGSTTVRWNSANATSCTASGGTNGWAGSKNLSSSFFTGILNNPGTSSTSFIYSITCTNNTGGSANASVVITVRPKIIIITLKPNPINN